MREREGEISFKDRGINERGEDIASDLTAGSRELEGDPGAMPGPQHVSQYGAGGYLERSPMLSHESQRAANEVNVKTERNTDKIAQSNAEILRLQQRAATEKDVEQNQERREAA